MPETLTTQPEDKKNADQSQSANQGASKASGKANAGNAAVQDDKTAAKRKADVKTEARQAAEKLVELKKDAEAKAKAEREDAQEALQVAAAEEAKAQSEYANGAVSDDPEYLKALNEEDGYTLVNADTVDDNDTVEKVGSKAYASPYGNGTVVVAKRKDA